jgi:hypothetical protein
VRLSHASGPLTSPDCRMGFAGKGGPIPSRSLEQLKCVPNASLMSLSELWAHPRIQSTLSEGRTMAQSTLSRLSKTLSACFLQDVAGID